MDNAQAGQGVPSGHDAAAKGAKRRLLRKVVSVVLVATGVMCLAAVPPTLWGRNLILDTDRYVQTLAPIASDPEMQSAVISAVDRQISSRIDVSGLLDDAVSPRAAAVLTPILQKAAASLVNSVTTDFVRGPGFPKLWETVNRQAHQQVVFALTGDMPVTGLQVDDGRIVLDLGPIVQRVKSALVGAGLTVAAGVPVVGATIQIAQLDGLTSAQRAVRLLDTIANWLPWIGLGLLLGGVLVSPRRRGTVVRSALGLGAAMLLLGVGLVLARHFYLDAIPATALPRATASDVFDMLVRYLRISIRGVLLVAVIVAMLAWLGGKAPNTGRTLAKTTVTMVDRLGDGPVGRIISVHTSATRLVIVAAPMLVLTLTDHPTESFSLSLIVLTGLILLAVELLRHRRLRSALAT